MKIGPKRNPARMSFMLQASPSIRADVNQAIFEVDILHLQAEDLHLATTGEKELTEAGYSFSAEEVIFVELKHRPGTLAKQVEKLADKSIGVRYAYATAHAKGQTTAVVIAVAEQDLDKASKLLG